MDIKRFKILIILLMIITSILFSGYIIRYRQYSNSLSQQNYLENELINYDEEKSNLENKIESIETNINVENENIIDLENKISKANNNINQLKEQIDVYQKLKTNDMTVFVTPNNEKIKSFVNQIDTDDPVNIYRFVRDEIKYLEDYLTYDYRFEYWQFPEETLTLKTGDCEDQAILLCTLFRAKGYTPEEVKIAFGLTTANTGHAWVELFYQGDWIVFDPTSSSSAYMEKTRYYSLINVNYKGSFNDFYYEVIPN